MGHALLYVLRSGVLSEHIYYPLKEVRTSWLHAFQPALDASPGPAWHYTSLTIPARTLWARVNTIHASPQTRTPNLQPYNRRNPAPAHFYYLVQGFVTKGSRKSLLPPHYFIVSVRTVNICSGYTPLG